MLRSFVPLLLLRQLTAFALRLGLIQALGRMKHQRVLLHATALLVVLPTTYLAALGSWVFFSLLYSALRGSPYANLSASVMAAAIAFFGCIGVATLWVIYFRLWRGSARPGLLIWLGLAAGVASSLLLMFVNMTDSPWPNRLIFGWPLIAAVVYGWFYKWQMRPNNSFKPKPLRGSA